LGCAEHLHGGRLTATATTGATSLLSPRLLDFSSTKSTPMRLISVFPVAIPVALGALLSVTAHAADVVDLTRSGDDAMVPADTVLPTRAGDFVLKLDGGVGIPLTTPQSSQFRVGAAVNAKALWALTPFLDIGPTVGFLSLPADDGVSAAGTALSAGVGLQFKRPHDGVSDGVFRNFAPFLDADALYVRTGELNRAGFDVALGALIPIDDNRVFWVGPFARYQQILQLPVRDGYDNSDAKTLIVGLTFELSPGVRRAPSVDVAAAPAPAATTIVKEVAVCADTDGDGVPDVVDRCFDVKGSLDGYGCPAYAHVVVRPDKLELKEKLYFAWDSAELHADSTPVLDDVVQALKDNKAAQVQVEGYTSSEGTEAHNQTLSEDRAATVRSYLVAHGIAERRLISKGFASATPRSTNDTAAGRENNRRVEFVVTFLFVNGNN
jgi:outer membrane protein OmpA-like peptidoglycan-associated protein